MDQATLLPGELTCYHQHTMIPAALNRLLERGALTHATLLVGGDERRVGEVAAQIQSRLGIAPADALHLVELPAVDELRRVLARIHLRPNQSTYTGLFLHQIDRWSPEAANTLLKTLEEPPVHARLVLFAADESAVLPTIRSRCAHYRLQGVRTTHPDVPALATLASDPLGAALTSLATLSESVPVTAILEHWVATTTGPFQRRLLARLVDLANRPVNRRLALESILVEYRLERTV